MTVQSIAVTASTAFGQLLLAIYYAVIARSTEPSAFGAAAAFIAGASVASGIIDFGLNSFATRELSARRLSPLEYGPMVVGKVLIAAVVAATWAVTAWLIAHDVAAVAACGIIVTAVLEQSLMVSLRASFNADKLAVVQLADRIAIGLGIAGTRPFVHDTRVMLIAGLILGPLIGAVVAFSLTPRAHRISIGREFGAPRWRESYGFGIAGLANSAISLDTTVVAMIAGPAVAGIYGAITRWTQPLGLPATAFSTVAAPVVAASRSGWHGIKQMRRSYWLLALAIATCAVVALFSEPIVSLILGTRYRASADVLRWLSIGVAVAIMNQPMSMVLQARRRDKPVALVLLGATVLYLSTVGALAARWGAVAIGVSYLAFQVIVFGALCWLLKVMWIVEGSDQR